MRPTDDSRQSEKYMMADADHNYRARAGARRLD